MASKGDKRRPFSQVRCAYRASIRNHALWFSLAGVAILSVVVVQLPLPTTDAPSAALDGCASLAFLAVILACAASLYVNPARDWSLYPSTGGASIGLNWLGSFTATSVGVCCLVFLQLLMCHQFVEIRHNPISEQAMPLALDSLSILAYALLVAVVLSAWSMALSLWTGRVIATVVLLLLGISASALPDAALRFPPLWVLPDIAALSPVGHALHGLPSAKLVGYALSHAVVPLALATTLQHVAAARGWRTRS